MWQVFGHDPSPSIENPAVSTKREMAPALPWTMADAAGVVPGADAPPERALEETMKKTYATLFAVAAAAVLGACSDSTGVSGSGNATMQASAIGDNNGTSNSVAAAPGEAPRFATTTASGTVDFRARVYVQTQAGGWVELTNNAAQHAVVDASGQAGRGGPGRPSRGGGSGTHAALAFAAASANRD